MAQRVWQRLGHISCLGNRHNTSKYFTYSHIMTSLLIKFSFSCPYVSFYQHLFLVSFFCGLQENFSFISCCIFVFSKQINIVSANNYLTIQIQTFFVLLGFPYGYVGEKLNGSGNKASFPVWTGRARDKCLIVQIILWLSCIHVNQCNMFHGIHNLRA
jgi:hypothetical protein